MEKGPDETVTSMLESLEGSISTRIWSEGELEIEGDESSSYSDAIRTIHHGLPARL